MALFEGSHTTIGAPKNVIATINGAAIETAEYQRALAAIAQDKRNPLSEEDKKRVLRRLVEEELLVQRAIEIGLVERDRSVRNGIVAAMTDHIVAPSRSDPVDPEILAAWYQENQDLFRHQVSYHLSPIDAKHNAIIPNALVPATNLLNYTGPEFLRRVEKLSVGESIEYQNTAYRLIGKSTPPAPEFDKVRDLAEAAYRRHKGEEDFLAYLEWLDGRSEISIDVSVSAP